MTRGTFVLFTDAKVLLSIEFNGEMGPDMMYGKQSLELIENTIPETFHNDIVAFNSSTFEYNDEYVDYKQEYNFILRNGVGSSMLNLKEGYYQKYFSDYLYIKNCTSDSIELTLKHKTHSLGINEWIVVYFGHTIEASSNWFQQLYSGNDILSEFILNGLALG